MRQNSKAALPPSIGIYINAPVTSGGNCLIIVVLQLWCDVTFVLRLWCYALSAISRRLCYRSGASTVFLKPSLIYVYVYVHICTLYIVICAIYWAARKMLPFHNQKCKNENDSSYCKNHLH